MSEYKYIDPSIVRLVHPTKTQTILSVCNQILAQTKRPGSGRPTESGVRSPESGVETANPKSEVRCPNGKSGVRSPESGVETANPKSEDRKSTRLNSSHT